MMRKFLTRPSLVDERTKQKQLADHHDKVGLKWVNWQKGPFRNRSNSISQDGFSCFHANSWDVQLRLLTVCLHLPTVIWRYISLPHFLC